MSELLDALRGLADEWEDAAADGACDPTTCEVCVRAEAGQELRDILARFLP